MAPPEPPRSPLALAEVHSRGRYTAAPRHLALLDEALVYLEQREAPAGFLRKLKATRPIPEDVLDDALLPFTRLVVEMPPRHAKSVTVSQYFSSWYLGRNPDHHVILTSYEDTFARSWGRKSRDVLLELGPEYFGVAVKTDTKAADEWDLTDGGGMLTAGIGGAITGRGANCFIGDDWVKNAQDAASEAIQDRNWDWWEAVASTRFEPGCICVIFMTRWHEKDVVGRILRSEEEIEEQDEGEVWYELRLPALADEEEDVLGRKIGEALWPERYSVGRLEATRRRIGSYYFGALYQQRPTPPEGGMFKRSAWQWYDQAPEGYHPGYTFVDTAGWDDKEDGDWCAYASIVRAQKDLFWLNARRGHWSFPQVVQELRDEHDRTGLPICVEKVPWAMPLIQTLQREMGIGAVVPFEIKGVQKEVRAEAVSVYHEAGNFYLPRRGQWTGEFVDEHAAFPKGAHDDWVDTTSMGGLKLLVKESGGGKAFSYA